MKVKKYIQFIKESSEYSLGCVMIELDINNWVDICSHIDRNDVYYDENDPTYGIQDNPHLTLFYGFHKQVTTEEVFSIIESYVGNEPIKIEVSGIDIFENENFDVVKLNVVKTDLLQKLNTALSNLPNSNEFRDYKPHITIAYVKNGTGRKYINPEYKNNFESNSLCYSKPNGEKIYFEI